MKLIALLSCIAGTAMADAPEITNVTVSGGRFDVTLTHPDTGWDHYADGWRVEDADGVILGTRVLGHPHVNEQPFTRSFTIDGPLPDVVFVRSRCIVDGWSDTVFEVATK